MSFWCGVDHQKGSITRKGSAKRLFEAFRPPPCARSCWVLPNENLLLLISFTPDLVSTISVETTIKRCVAILSEGSTFLCRLAQTIRAFHRPNQLNLFN